MSRSRIIILVFAAAIAALFAYANFRELSASEKLKHVALASFMLKGKITEAERLELEKRISGLSGVTACSINKDGDGAAVIFYPDVVTAEILSSALRNNGSLNVKHKILPSSGGCPVHQVGTSFTQMISLLDFRN